MPGCEIYQIKRLEKFDQSFIKVIKNHYKKSVKEREKFLDLIDSYVGVQGSLRISPLDNAVSDKENFPKGSHKQDFYFRKTRFRMPGLQGISAKGRLMYVVHSTSCSVFPLWLYTHNEFPMRPSDSELKEQLLIVESIVLSEIPDKPSLEL